MSLIFIGDSQTVRLLNTRTPGIAVTPKTTDVPKMVHSSFQWFFTRYSIGTLILYQNWILESLLEYENAILTYLMIWGGGEEHGENALQQFRQSIRHITPATFEDIPSTVDHVPSNFDGSGWISSTLTIYPQL